MLEALWQLDELSHLGSLAVQGQNLSDRSAESQQNGFTQILNGLEVKGLLPMFFMNGELNWLNWSLAVLLGVFRG